MKPKFWKLLLTIIIASGLPLVLLLLGFFQSWQNLLTDKLFLKQKLQNKIVIVAIDNNSLQALGRWPWDRNLQAQLLEKINQTNPAAIGLDVNFPEVSNLEADYNLAKAIQSSKKVILPLEGKLVTTKIGNQVSDLLEPLPELKAQALSLGLTNMPPDRDGVVRRLPVIARIADGQMIEAFSVVIARAYLKTQNIDPNILTSNNQLIINYSGQPGTFPMISAKDVLANNFNQELLKNKIVLIGATAPDLHDEQLVPTSQGKPMSGVEIHAQAIETIISGRYLSALSFFWQALIIFLAGIILGIILILFKIRTAIISLISLIYIITAAVLFDQGLVLNLFYFGLVMSLVFVVGLAHKYILASQEKKFIKASFGHYVSEEIIEQLIKYPERLKLGGEKKELTILFSDIRGFTSISEKLNPEALVALLNSYLTLMTQTIMDEAGVIDKYIGDAIMAFWGAPLDDKKQALHSCQAAYNMIELLKSNQEKWLVKYDIDLKIGIGINTGDCVVGNMGSEKRFDYTVMGDSVNLASRLEGLTKNYRVSIIISEFTYNLVKNEFLVRVLDRVAVKGKAEAVKIYELICPLVEASSKQLEFSKKFQQAFDLYQSSNWIKAQELFLELSNNNSGDQVCQMYIERCREILVLQPDNWDGIYYWQTK